jgi:hypothetical protein
MQQENSAYRTNESLLKQFSNSCLGKIVIAGVIFLVLLLVAWLTNPSDRRMRNSMHDNIRQSIESRDSINSDFLDEIVSNIGHTFTWTDEPENKERMALFDKYNLREFYDHTFFSTMYIFNTLTTEHERCGVGLFGLVIPTVNFNKFLLREGPMRQEYNEPLIQQKDDDEYFGQDPPVDIFRYEGE